MRKQLLIVFIILLITSLCHAKTMEGYFSGDDQGPWIAWTDYGKSNAMAFSDRDQTLFITSSVSISEDMITMNFGLFLMTGLMDPYGEIYGSWTDSPYSGYFSGKVVPRHDYQKFSGAYTGRYSGWKENGSFRLDVSGDGTLTSRLTPDSSISFSGTGAVLSTGEVFAAGGSSNTQSAYTIRGTLSDDSFEGLLRKKDGTEYWLNGKKETVIIIIPDREEDSGSDCFIGVSSSGSHAAIAVH